MPRDATKTTIRSHLKRALTQGDDINYSIDELVDFKDGNRRMELSVRWTEPIEPEDAENVE